MEVFSYFMAKIIDAGEFIFHPRCEEFRLTHLCFVDDLIIFSRGDVHSISGVLNILEEFSKMSGLNVNKLKSQVFGAGIPVEIKARSVIQLQM